MLLDRPQPAADWPASELALSVEAQLCGRAPSPRRTVFQGGSDFRAQTRYGRSAHLFEHRSPLIATGVRLPRGMVGLAEVRP